ncbi:MAG TPA: hypothetical protein VFM64_00075 [Candidatus Nitrosotenuis sp.]|nr:hypothetical protein [Candidatus Nitrosotenuis sp.]
MSLQYLESLETTEPNNYAEIAAILQSIAAKVGSVQVESYFRAGRAYFTINHTMGPAGNLFFKTAFEKLLRNSAKPHVTTNQNEISRICRI